MIAAPQNDMPQGQRVADHAAMRERLKRDSSSGKRVLDLDSRLLFNVSRRVFPVPDRELYAFIGKLRAVTLRSMLDSGRPLLSRDAIRVIDRAFHELNISGGEP